MTNLSVGAIMAFAGDASNVAIHQNLLKAGWLPCWGQSVAIATYPDLAAAIGAVYEPNPANPDPNNVTLPDLRGRFIRGAGGRAAGAAFGVGQVLAPLTATPQTGSFSLDSAGAHTHNLSNVPGWSNSSTNAPGSDNAAWNDGSVATTTAGSHTHTVTGGGDSQTRPVNVYVDYIIKVLDPDSTVDE